LENLKTAGYIYEKKILEQKLKDIFEMFPKLESMKKLKPSELSGG